MVGPRARSGASLQFAVLLVGVLVVANALVAGATAGTEVRSSSGSSGGAAPIAAEAPPSTDLAGAVGSLERGAAPFAGRPLECTAASDSAQCAAPFAAHPSVATGQWWNLTAASSIRPAAREFLCLADDPADGYVLLFGGANTSVAFGDTWKYSGGTWTQLFPSVAPTARYLGGMVFDAADGYVVMYGGGNATQSYFHQTWKYSGGTWTQLSPSQSPNAVVAFGMTYDAADRAVLLFGGLNDTQAQVAETWEFAHGQWTELFPSESPPSRVFPSLAYDATDGYAVLFGGLNATQVPLADSWRFADGGWTLLTPSVHPSPRAGAPMAWDPDVAGLVLYGGTNLTHETTDTWRFSGGGWTELSTTADPGTLLVAGFVTDSEDGGLLLYGGGTHNSGGMPVANTWEFAPSVAVSPLASPASADAGQSIGFQANASFGIKPYTFAWTFGGGRTATASNPSITFATAGAYTANVTVKDLTGTEATGSVTVTVAPALTVHASVSTNATTVGTPLTFAAAATGGKAPYTYAWTFGDQATAANASPSHVYANASTYEIRLTVTDANGATANGTLTVTVRSTPSSSAGFPVVWVVLAVVVGLVVVALAGLLMRRSRTPPATPAMPPTLTPAPPPSPGPASPPPPG